jgi:transcriptional regulator with GAF, ATPase, and Fis domain
MNNNMMKRQVTRSLFTTVAKKGPAAGQIHHLDCWNQVGIDKPRSQSFDVFYNIMGSIPVPLVMLNYDLKVVKANRCYYETFNVKPKNIVGQLLFDLGNRQWDIPKLKELLEDVTTKNSVINDFEVKHDFETIGRRIMHLNARRILDKNSSVTRLILLSIEDVTDWKRQERDLMDLIEQRTVELIVAREDAEKGKESAETSISQIKKSQKKQEVEAAYLHDEIKLEYNYENIIGQSNGLKYVLYKVGQIACSNTTVLVLGETGTGKELVARAIHSSSLRKNQPLIKVNCATLPSNLIESELFGHEKGAFTDSPARRLGRFEVADGATLFLDEIGELPLEQQTKLLRVIQDGEFERLGSSHTIKVDTRIIAATNRNLEEEVRKGNFRQDLWYRLNVFPIIIPPLRDRLDDIPLLVKFHIQKISKRLAKTIEIIPANVIDALQDYHWPGNIRELENVLERAVINSSGPKLHLVDKLKKPSQDVSRSPKTLEEVERNYILQVLEQTRWKISGKNSASEILGIDRSTLRARMLKLNIKKR